MKVTRVCKCYMGYGNFDGYRIYGLEFGEFFKGFMRVTL